MKLAIHFRNMRGNGDIVGYIDHRLSFAFSRTVHHIESLTVTLTDVNGPKSGVDKQCRILVKATGLRTVVVTECSDDIRRAVDRCIARASQSLERKLKHRKTLWKKIPGMKNLNADQQAEDRALSDMAKAISL